MQEFLRLPHTAKELKNQITQKKGCTSHELNDEILIEMKREFDNLKIMEIINGTTLCGVSLNRAQQRFFNDLKRMYGISFSQLYIRAIVKIAKTEKII